MHKLIGFDGNGSSYECSMFTPSNLTERGARFYCEIKDLVAYPKFCVYAELETPREVKFGSVDVSGLVGKWGARMRA